MKIPLGRAKLLHADGQTDTKRHDETNSRSSQFYERGKTEGNSSLCP